MTVLDRAVKIRKFFIEHFSQKKNTENVAEMESFIISLGEPYDLIERSYFQYLCQKQRYCYSRVNNLIFNIGGTILLWMIKLLPAQSARNEKKEETKTAFCIQSKKIKDRIPPSLSEEFDTIIFNEQGHLRITKYEKKYIKNLRKRYPHDRVFLCKILMKMCMYRDIIERYNVKAIIATSEDSYTSSILTDYCRKNNVEHINIMHGEIIYSVMRTFFEFDRCYVWDEYYKKLCIDFLKAPASQFIIERPPCLYFDTNIKEKYDYKYYLQIQTPEEMQQIKDIMDALSDNYMVRPHPLHVDEKNLVNIFGRDRIEDSTQISIEQSIMETKTAIAWNSTALYQAYCNGKNTIIDDMTNTEIYEWSKNAKYIMTEKKTALLSEVVSNLIEHGGQL